MHDMILLAQSDPAPLFFVGFFLFLMLLSLLSLVFWLWALISAIQNPALDDNTRIIWVLIIVLTGVIGAIIYLIVGQPGSSGKKY